jgi:hypothetical protein
VRVNGRVSIDDVNEALDVKLPQDGGTPSVA